MPDFSKGFGRLEITYRRDYGANACVSVKCLAGWNDLCRVNDNQMSIEEARDLHYSLGRLLAHVDADQNAHMPEK